MMIRRLKKTPAEPKTSDSLSIWFLEKHFFSVKLLHELDLDIYLGGITFLFQSQNI